MKITKTPDMVRGSFGSGNASSIGGVIIAPPGPGTGGGTGIVSSSSNTASWQPIISSITANGSNANTLIGPNINIASGSNISLSTSSNTLTIHSLGTITVKDEGTILTTGATSMDFVGAGVTATNVAGAVSVSIGGGAAASVPTAIVRHTAANISITSTTVAVLSGVADLTLAASAGDVILLSINARCPNTTANSIRFDAATIVSAAAVNFVSSLTSTQAVRGVPGWFIGGGDDSGKSAPLQYVVQAGDVSGGNVVFRVYAWVSGTRTIGASSDEPFLFIGANLGQ